MYVVSGEKGCGFSLGAINGWGPSQLHNFRVRGGGVGGWGTQLVCVEFTHGPVDYDLTICTLL